MIHQYAVFVILSIILVGSLVGGNIPAYGELVIAGVCMFMLRRFEREEFKLQ